VKKSVIKTAVLFSVLVLFQAPAKAFGPEENALIQKIFDFRLRLRTLDTEDECIEKIIEYRNSLSDEMKTFSEEAQITCTNMLSTAQYNCEYAKDMKSPNMEKILRPQYEKITQFTRANKGTDLNPWFILTSADVLNSMMQFLPTLAPALIKTWCITTVPSPTLACFEIYASGETMVGSIKPISFSSANSLFLGSLLFICPTVTTAFLHDLKTLTRSSSLPMIS